MTSSARITGIAFGASAAIVGALLVSGTAQAVTDTVFQYSAAKTGYYSISPMSLAFAGDGGNADKAFFIQTNSVVRPTYGGCFLTGVNLPQGAVIKQLSVWFDTGASPNFIPSLTRLNFATGSLDLLAIANVGSNTPARKQINLAVTNASFGTVDNATYSYGFQVCIGPNDAFYAARIMYTFTNAGD